MEVLACRENVKTGKDVVLQLKFALGMEAKMNLFVNFKERNVNSLSSLTYLSNNENLVVQKRTSK